MSDGEDCMFTSESEASKNGGADNSDDFEENWYEENGISPSTHMSITGILHNDMLDDSNDFIYSDDEVAFMAPQNIKRSSINEENSVRSYRSSNNNSNSSSRVSIFDDELSVDSQNSSRAASIQSISSFQDSNISSNRSSLNECPVKIIVTNDDNNESSVMNSVDILKGYSSLSHLSKPTKKSPRRYSSDGDVEIINAPIDLIELSSDNDSNFSFNNKKPRRISTSSIDEDQYEEQLRELNKIELQLSDAENVMRNLPPHLPDGGKRLSESVQRLTKILVKKTTEMSKMKVRKGTSSKIIELNSDDDRPSVSRRKRRISNTRISIDSKDSDDVMIVNKPVNAGTYDWKDVSKDIANQKNSGSLTMKAFNHQRDLTIERLKSFNNEQKHLPAENSLATDPHGLKVKLMKHQKYALTWLKWREQQSLCGGILADDMGLGKTLTMISLILASKSQNSENGDQKRNGGTLIVCPASLIRQWQLEIESKTADGKLFVVVHHGPGRDCRKSFLIRHDIVITTYALLSDDYQKRGPLHSINWHRVILDEAHVIRNRDAKISKAACAVKAKHHWALTGTPVQNRANDVYAILTFLNCTPFDDISVWRTWITSREIDGPKRLNLIMKTIMLRRTKAELIKTGELKGLPSKKLEIIEIELNQNEMNVYQKILAYSRKLFADYLSQRSESYGQLGVQSHSQAKQFNSACLQAFQAVNQTEMKNVKTYEILVLLLRLRQVCVHPGLVETMLDDEAMESDFMRSTTQFNINLLDEVQKMTNAKGDMKKVERVSAQILRRDNPVFDLKKPSTKLSHILDAASQCIRGTNDKAIIVSQWTSVLNILKTHLTKSGIPTLSLDGKVPVKDRQEIVSTFNNAKSSIKILLLSLTAGGVGLNLVGANHLFLVDLHWNPQLEVQAQDRIYRVGQKKDVFIYKFICKNTVEEKIKTLQEHKLEIASGVLSGDDGSRLSLQNLQQLFDF